MPASMFESFLHVREPRNDEGPRAPPGTGGPDHIHAQRRQTWTGEAAPRSFAIEEDADASTSPARRGGASSTTTPAWK